MGLKPIIAGNGFYNAPPSADGGPPTGSASGDLSGSYPSPTVAKIGGVAVTIDTDGTLSANSDAKLASQKATRTYADATAAAAQAAAIAASEPVLTAVTQAEAEAGTGTNKRSWTPERVAQAIAALAPRVLQSETKSYLAAVIAAGGSIGARRLAALDELVSTAKSQGWWEKILEAYPFCTDAFAGVFVKLKAATGCPDSLTNNNFVSSDYTPEGGFGIDAANASKWLQSGFTPSVLGYTRANIGIICAPCSDQVTAGAASGRTWGDMISGNTGECGVFFQHHSTNMVIGNGSYSWQALNPVPRVLSFHSSGSLYHSCADGVQLTSWPQTTSGTLTGEITGWRVTRFSANRYENGRVGFTAITAYMTPTEAKQATAAIARFERQVRACYRSGEPGVIWHGDSITAGQGPASPNDSFALLVSRKSGLRAVQFGIQSAWLTSDTGQIAGANSIANILTACPEGEIWSCFGANDVQYGVTATTFATSIDALALAVKTARRRGGIATTPMSTNATHQTTLRAYAVKCATAAVANGLAFADVNMAMVDALAAGTTVNADTVHPNLAGHAVIAKCLEAARRGIQWRAPLLSFGAIAAGAAATVTVDMLTVRIGDRVAVTPPAGLNAGIVISAWVSAADVVTLRAFNATSGSITPDTDLFQIQVWT